jgi:pteridine reductase
MPLTGKLIVITGAARRIGRAMALHVARSGADVVIHYNTSYDEAVSIQEEIKAIGRKAYLVQANFANPEAPVRLIEQARAFGPLFALVNNAAIYEPLNWDRTTLEDWNRHLMINLTTPFLLSQSFARVLEPQGNGRIVNMLDWRSFRSDPDHLPYTISKAALAALTSSLAIALAPQVTVTSLALGAVLPPSKGTAPADILEHIPIHRWTELDEVNQALTFLLEGPINMTGEVLYIDGGRHLV